MSTQSKSPSRAVLVEGFGAPSSFRLVDRDPGLPGPGEVRLRVKAAGISFVDVLTAEGGYQIKPPLPFVPGSEHAGVIEAVGAGVPEHRIGERVCAETGVGAFAEASIVPAAAARPLPPTMSFEEGAILLASYSTSYHALVQRAELAAGQTLAVLGAGGAVGYAACEIGKALGAKVIASVSTAEKRDLARRAGVDAVIDSSSPSWRDDLRDANGGRPVDVVFDPVGGAMTEPAFRSLAWKGRLLVVGFAGGGIAKLPANLALLKGASMVGVNVRGFAENEPDVAEANIEALFALYREGKLHPPIARSYALEDFVDAMVEARSGRMAGRILVRMSDEISSL